MGAAPGFAGERRSVSHARGRLAAYSHAARSFVKIFAADAGGSAAIEYALIATLIALVVIGALVIIGTRLNVMIAAVVPGLQ
jgi:Flp pilus assembly pilin Flp